MGNRQIVDTILRSVEKELNLFIEQEGEITCPIEYEKRVISLARQFGQSILKESRGTLPKSRNSKKRYRRV